MLSAQWSKMFKKEKKVEPEVDPVEEYCKSGGKKSDVVICNAYEVTDFSSQYGGERSMSYTACNLAGRGNIYPSYGDFTQACVFRTYGPWWDIAPSRKAPFERTPPSFCSQDYIELSFQTKVYPLKLEIYETYNPGCVVKILACQNSDETDVDTGRKPTRWKTLWEEKPSLAGRISRMFCPTLKPCPFPTNLLRLELCHKLVHYYTELDYVVLYGSPSPEEEQPSTPGKKVDKQVTMATKQLEKLALNKVPEGIGQGDVEIGDEVRTDSDNGYMDLLPEEVIQLILSYLDVLSLCRVARTSRLLYKHSYDSLQYTELNLQPHWPQVNNIALESLHSRSRFLQRLNLSWCHQNIVSETAFCRYIENCGKTLEDLYLSSCSFVTKNSIQHISKYCPNLKELDIGSCKEIGGEGFYDISNLAQLERLNLYRTDIEQAALLKIIRSCPNLQHLNLGSVSCSGMLDEVLLTLSDQTRHLKSLDVWRCDGVSSVGVSSLSKCTELEELDIGWCGNVKSSSDCIIEIIKNCLNLKKLFLTANRTVCNKDILAVAEYSKHLEQLDILGTSLVSSDTALRVLEKCEKLKFFDVSFCSGIDNHTVMQWSQQYPHVGIKKSFQNPE